MSTFLFVLLPSWKRSIWRQETETCDTLFHFLLIVMVWVFFTKSKPRREQLVITKKTPKQAAFHFMKLLACLLDSQILSFGPSFFVCLFVKYCCFCRAICIKGMKKNFLHISRIYWFLKPLSPVVIVSPVKYYLMEPMANLLLNGYNI